MGWFKRKKLSHDELPTLVKFSNGKFAIRRKLSGEPYQYLSLVYGSCWYESPDYVGDYCMADEVKARESLERLCAYSEKGEPV